MKVKATQISTAGQIHTESASMLSLFKQPSTKYRLGYSIASAALIGSIYLINTAPLGALLVLPLIGIYTGLGMVLGRSPLATIIDANKPIQYIVPPVSEGITARSESHAKAVSRAA